MRSRKLSQQVIILTKQFIQPQVHSRFFIRPFDNILSIIQSGCRKSFNTQYSLMAMVEKWKWIHDKGGSCGALLTGYIEAFDCIVHQFLIDKLEVCDFTYEVFNIGNYLQIEHIEQKLSLDLLIRVPHLETVPLHGKRRL